MVGKCPYPPSSAVETGLSADFGHHNLTMLGGHFYAVGCLATPATAMMCRRVKSMNLQRANELQSHLPGRSGRTVLVVEDENRVADFISRGIRAEGASRLWR